MSTHSGVLIDKHSAIGMAASPKVMQT